MHDINLEKLVSDSIISSIKDFKKNPKSVAYQVFLPNDSTTMNMYKYKDRYALELLLPLNINIFDHKICFALVLKSNDKYKMYEIMSIITRDMAFVNARIVGPIKVNWLHESKPQLKSKLKCKAHINTIKTSFIDNPFFYIATTLPLKLPSLKFAKTKQYTHITL